MRYQVYFPLNIQSTTSQCLAFMLGAWFMFKRPSLLQNVVRGGESKKHRGMGTS